MKNGTLTVSEVMAELVKHPSDMPVYFEWRELPRCSCFENDVYCYCPMEDNTGAMATVDKSGGIIVIRGQKVYREA